MKKYILNLSTTALGALFFSLPLLAMEPENPDSSNGVVVSLNFQGKDLKDIDFIPKCFPDVTNLNLADNGSMNVPRHGCPTWKGSIEDFSPMTSLTNLRDLDLTNTGLTSENLLYISGLTNLTRLNLEENFKLQEDLGPLTSLQSLTALSVGNTGCGDDTIDSILRLTNLTKLHTYNNEAPNITFEHLTNLVELDMWNMGFRTLETSGLDRLTKLTHLNMGHNGDLGNPEFSASLTKLIPLQNLTSLNLAQCYLTVDDFRTVENVVALLPNLTYLSAAGNDGDLKTLNSFIEELKFYNPRLEIDLSSETGYHCQGNESTF